MAPRTGRPPSEDPRNHVVPVRLTEGEDALIKEAAGESKVKASEFIRDSALAAAKKTVRAAKRG